MAEPKMGRLKGGAQTQAEAEKLTLSQLELLISGAQWRFDGASRGSGVFFGRKPQRLSPSNSPKNTTDPFLLRTWDRPLVGNPGDPDDKLEFGRNRGAVWFLM